MPGSYIVRIYRQGFRSLSGTVEDTVTQGQRAFRDPDELIDLLRAPIPREPISGGDPDPLFDDKETP